MLPIIRSTTSARRQRLSRSPGRGTGSPYGARSYRSSDIYDALTSDRPYRMALTPEQAFSTVREEAARGWWDGGLVDELESLLKSSPDLSLAPAGLLVCPLARRGGASSASARYWARCT